MSTGQELCQRARRVDPCLERRISYTSIRTWCNPSDSSRGTKTYVSRGIDMRHRAPKLKWRRTICSPALFGRYDMPVREGRDVAGVPFSACLNTCA
jgi:hypothetical protein